MSQVRYRNRNAWQLENDYLRVTVTLEGGHVAEILHKASGINPLWTPPWPSVEPSAYSSQAHPEYGDSAEARLLSGILGHSLCLDTYGAPSAEEAAAGIPIHGEAPVVLYQVSEPADHGVTLSALLPLAQIRFERRLSLRRNVLRFDESVENLAAFDRPIAWTQHVTLGPPFIQPGRTALRMPVTRSLVIDDDFGGPQQPGASFNWPMCPRADGSFDDLRVYPAAPQSAGFTTHLVDPALEQAHFVAWNPADGLAFGYAWRRRDFPWVCRWEENRARAASPWNSRTVTCAVEFGVSPTLGSRRQVVDHGPVFETPAFRWLPAKAKLTASYCAFAGSSAAAPEKPVFHPDADVTFE